MEHFYISFKSPRTMESVPLLIITVITAISTVSCKGDFSRDSLEFSITSYGRLRGAVIFAMLKDDMGDCLYACMQHLSCLTVSYNQSPGRYELMADVLIKNDINDKPGWASYGHFESSKLFCISHQIFFR